MKQRYTVPVTGRVLNWETLSGDPSDPIRADAIPLQVSAGITAKEHKGITVTLLEIDADAGTAVVEVEGAEVFHQTFAEWLLGKTPEQAAQAIGKAIVKRVGNPMPKVSLRFNDHARVQSEVAS